VVADPANPARIQLAAHALRELLNELEHAAGLAPKKPSLKERVHKLYQQWEAAQPSLEINPDRSGFVQTLSEFFKEFHDDYPTRRDQGGITIDSLDPARRVAPPAVREARADLWMDFRDNLNRIAHGKECSDAEFREQLQRLEGFLFDLLRPRTLADFREIDELLEKTSPDAEPARRRMLELVRKSPANHEYFFNKLDDVVWLNVLESEGFFRKPPEPERGEDWIRFPPWPESRYLARVAPQAPRKVLDLVAGISATENIRVHEDVLRIAAQLPGKMATRLARKEACWLRDYRGDLWSLPEAGGELLAHLAREREIGAAFKLACTLLEIRPAQEPASTRRRAVARMSEYSYGRVIERAWSALMDGEPARALGFLCDRLADVVRIGFTEPDGDRDLTCFWRPAIEDHAQNLGHSLLDTLVDAVRDLALRAAQTPAGLELVLAELERRPGPLFRRLELHLLRRCGPAEIVASALTNTKLARDIEVWHEYSELLRDRFADLTPEQQKSMLEVIARGPGLELTPAHQAHGMTAADLARQEDAWRLQRYALIAEHLDGELRRRYEELRAEHGEPHEPTFLIHSQSWTGPTSPWNSDELRAMGPRGVVHALREWNPPGGFEDPSPEGLGWALEQAVAADAGDFAAAAVEFRGLDPIYVRALLAGLAGAAKRGVPFPWSPVLELCAWILKAGRSNLDAAQDAEAEQQWGRARRQVAGLLSRGLAQGAAQIPHGERRRVWRVLTVLAEDPDPTPEHEERCREGNMDPVTLSINTTRGEAIHAVVRYALWVEGAHAGSGRFAAMTSVPEVKRLLERHLDPTADPSLAIRSVYGQWFPQFVRLDKDWARRIAPRIFPHEPELGAYFDAAWSAYIVFNRASTDVFEVLRDAYALAVKRLHTGSVRTPFAGDPGERLGAHLLAYRAWGATSGGDDLFAAFWRQAGPDLQRETLAHVGESLRETQRLDPDVHDRLTATWEWILKDANGGEAASLARFGAWLATSALEGRWLLRQALAVLNRGIHLEPDFVVYEALPRLALEHPREVVEVLRLMVQTDAQGWSLEGSIGEVREALRIVLAAKDREAQERAEELIHLLAARGMAILDDLLSDA